MKKKENNKTLFDNFFRTKNSRTVLVEFNIGMFKRLREKFKKSMQTKTKKGRPKAKETLINLPILVVDIINGERCVQCIDCERLIYIPSSLSVLQPKFKCGCGCICIDPLYHPSRRQHSDSVTSTSTTGYSEPTLSPRIPEEDETEEKTVLVISKQEEEHEAEEEEEWVFLSPDSPKPLVMIHRNPLGESWIDDEHFNNEIIEDTAV